MTLTLAAAATVTTIQPERTAWAQWLDGQIDPGWRPGEWNAAQGFFTRRPGQRPHARLAVRGGGMSGAAGRRCLVQCVSTGVQGFRGELGAVRRRARPGPAESSRRPAGQALPGKPRRHPMRSPCALPGPVPCAPQRVAAPSPAQPEPGVGGLAERGHPLSSRRAVVLRADVRAAGVRPPGVVPLPLLPASPRRSRETGCGVGGHCHPVPDRRSVLIAAASAARACRTAVCAAAPRRPRRRDQPESGTHAGHRTRRAHPSGSASPQRSCCLARPDDARRSPGTSTRSRGG